MDKRRFLIILLALALSLTVFTGCSFNEFFELLEDETTSEIHVEGGDSDKFKHKWSEWTCVSQPTCEAEGREESKCKLCGGTGWRAISAKGHTEEKIPGYAATGDKPGLTIGIKCSVCGKLITAQREIPILKYSDTAGYASHYAYDNLGNLKHGREMQELYSKFDQAAAAFHSDESAEISKDGAVFKADYLSLGLTLDQAIAAWVAFKLDHPLYYWISTELTYSRSEINLLAEKSYRNWDDRATYNDYVYGMVYECEEYVSGCTTVYDKALGVYEKIINDYQYAYSSDGTTPDNSEWAHTVLGFAKYGKGVCESYAKTYQLILNHLGIENILVNGELNGANHMWNLIRFDDGQWYWCDLTQGDTPDWWRGITYNFFCVTDGQLIEWRDGSYELGRNTFLSEHKPSEKIDDGIDFFYSIPARAATRFSDDRVCVMRDALLIDGIYYTRISGNTVQVIGIDPYDSQMSIPDTVEYQGREYRVTAIGAMNEKGIINCTERIKAHETLKELTIPASVEMIWDMALNIDSLEEIKVSRDNRFYSSSDGVLYTKSGYTLIHYPASNEREEFTVPETVKFIAYGAFYGKNALTKLVIGKNVLEVGIINWGYNYPDSDADARDSFGLENAVGEEQELRTVAAYMKNKKGIIRQKQNDP